MPVIKKLPSTLVDQIKAGEIIERPASVLKELIENSIDAGATTISISFKSGGKDFLRIHDNGKGMDPVDLKNCIEPFATSKISEFNDLYSLKSFGFRGEALASISSVSKITLSSLQSGSDTAFKYCPYLGEELTPTAQSEGTTILIEDLFYNTPVRKKFLSSDRSETMALYKVFISFLISYPQISFSYHNIDRKKLSFSSVNSKSERFFQIFKQELHSFTIEQADFKLEFCISDPDNTVSKAGSRSYIFVNGRFIKDKSINSAVFKAFSNFIESGRYPIFLLEIHISPEFVDFNVHPQKTEVRFTNHSNIISSIIIDLSKYLQVHFNDSDQDKEKPSEHLTPISNSSFYSWLNQKQVPRSPALPIDQKDHIFSSPSVSSPSNKPFNIEILSPSFLFLRITKTDLPSIFDFHSFVDQHFQELLNNTNLPIEHSLFPKPFKISNAELFDKLTKNLSGLRIEIDLITKDELILRSYPGFFILEPLTTSIIALFSKSSEQVSNDRLISVFKGLYLDSLSSFSASGTQSAKSWYSEGTLNTILSDRSTVDLDNFLFPMSDKTIKLFLSLFDS